MDRLRALAWSAAGCQGRLPCGRKRMLPGRRRLAGRASRRRSRPASALSDAALDRSRFERQGKPAPITPLYPETWASASQYSRRDGRRADRHRQRTRACARGCEAAGARAGGAAARRSGGCSPRTCRPSEDLPPFDSSAMDGYAVIAGPAGELEVVDESRAGHPARRALARRSGDRDLHRARRCPTAPTRWCRWSACERERRSGARAGHGVGRQHAPRGRGRAPPASVVLRAGAALGPAELAVAASVGHASLPCGAAPAGGRARDRRRAGRAGQPLGPGQIRNSNATRWWRRRSARARASAASEIVPDSLEATRAALALGARAADVVVRVGRGVRRSARPREAGAVASWACEESFWGVALKPGKPTWFGTRGRHARLRPAGQPGVGDGHLPAVRAARRCARCRARDPDDTRATRHARRSRSRATRDRDAGRALSGCARATTAGTSSPPRTPRSSHVLTLDARRRRRSRSCCAGEGERPAGRARGDRAALLSACVPFAVRPTLPTASRSRGATLAARVHVVDEPESEYAAQAVRSQAGRAPR